MNQDIFKHWLDTPLIDDAREQKRQRERAETYAENQDERSSDGGKHARIQWLIDNGYLNQNDMSLEEHSNDFIAGGRL